MNTMKDLKHELQLKLSVSSGYNADDSALASPKDDEDDHIKQQFQTLNFIVFTIL